MLLDGINVINTIAIPIYEDTFVFYLPAIFIIIIVLMLIGIGLFELATCQSIEDIPTTYVVIMFVLFILALIGICIEPGKVQIDTKYQYVVTISDEVGFNEFNQKYDILEVDGNLYTIEEKGNQDADS